jgi:hypothetical protein
MEERSERNRRIQIIINGLIRIIRAVQCKSSCCKSECTTTSSRSASPSPEEEEEVIVQEEVML